MQLLLTSCSFKHWAGWRHNHTQNCVSPCAWVKLIVSRIVVFAQGPCFLHEQISSNSICACHPRARGHEFFTGKKKRPEFVRVILVQAILPYRSKKKLPISDLECHSCQALVSQVIQPDPPTRPSSHPKLELPDQHRGYFAQRTTSGHGGRPWR